MHLANISHNPRSLYSQWIFGLTVVVTSSVVACIVDLSERHRWRHRIALEFVLVTNASRSRWRAEQIWVGKEGHAVEDIVDDGARTPGRRGRVDKGGGGMAPEVGMKKLVVVRPNLTSANFSSELSVVRRENST